MNESGHFTTGMSKHRIDALTDGIFAVAMTLLVIELKIPESVHITDGATMLSALSHLMPKFFSWVISFLVLAIFWYGHHRAFHFVKKVDGKLVALNLLFLGFVSFMPFASAMGGEYTRLIAGQAIYSGTMFMVAVGALLVWRYVHRHPELCHPAMSEGTYLGARFRTTMLMVISVVAVVIATYIPGAGNSAFMIMFLVGPIGRRIEAKHDAKHLSSKDPNATLSV